jgi:predicted kinase
MNEHAPGPRLIIICGLPGSGKTTLSRTLEMRLNAIRFCPDEWMQALSLDVYDELRRAKIEALQWELSRRLLSHGLTVIIEWGTWGRSERDALRMGAREMGAAVELHYLPATEEVLLQRIQHRGLENPPISRDDLSRWIDMFEAPTPEELALFDPPLLSDAVFRERQ